MKQIQAMHGNRCKLRDYTQGKHIQCGLFDVFFHPTTEQIAVEMGIYMIFSAFFNRSNLT